MPTTSTPVAAGSRVPACPTARVPRRRRSRATTSWLVGPAGLSTTRMPCTSGALSKPDAMPLGNPAINHGLDGGPDSVGEAGYQKSIVGGFRPVTVEPNGLAKLDFPL